MDWAASASGAAGLVSGTDADDINAEGAGA